MDAGRASWPRKEQRWSEECRKIQWWAKLGQFLASDCKKPAVRSKRQILGHVSNFMLFSDYKKNNVPLKISTVPIISTPFLPHENVLE